MSECSASCGGGFYLDVFHILIEQDGEGEACPQVEGATRTVACNPDDCRMLTVCSFSSLWKVESLLPSQSVTVPHHKFPRKPITARRLYAANSVRSHLRPNNALAPSPVTNSNAVNASMRLPPKKTVFVLVECSSHQCSFL